MPRRVAIDYIKLQFTVPKPVPPYTYDASLPYNALQQLAYFSAVFLLAPWMILTGLWQSPGLLGRFPWMEKVLNRQAARSLHFVGMILFLGFVLVHIFMVLVHGFPKEMGHIVLGEEHGINHWLAGSLGLVIIAVVPLACWGANWVSERRQRVTHHTIAALVDPVRRALLHFNNSRQDYPEDQISPHFRINGYPPIAAYPQARGDDTTYENLLSGEFRRLPASKSLAWSRTP